MSQDMFCIDRDESKKSFVGYVRMILREGSNYSLEYCNECFPLDLEQISFLGDF